jgi:hypothetical protein
MDKAKKKTAFTDYIAPSSEPFRLQSRCRLEFKGPGTTETYKNYIYEEIKDRLNSGNAVYCSVQNILPPSLNTWMSLTVSFVFMRLVYK